MDKDHSNKKVELILNLKRKISQLGNSYNKHESHEDLERVEIHL